MQDTPPASDFRDDLEPIWTPTLRKRLAWAAGGLLIVSLLVVIPPLISVNRYQKRVASGISQAIGRPVHFDNITLHLLPLPSLTISNFVVSENPSFGAEPVLRANTVEARLRLGSLWRRRIEVSRISLDTPSINLVRRTDGAGWNLRSILMQASHMNSAPTAQTSAGDAPRFPYIEATDARINIKNGIDKMPFSIKEAQFSLWLPEPTEWHLRFTGKPVRTDTDVSDVGLLRVEATLGRAADLTGAPIDLTASWKPTPLGEASKLTAGYDLGWRGEVSAEAALKGTLGEAKLTTDLHLTGLRRADFVPANTAAINAHCEATQQGMMHTLHDLRCAVPTNEDTSIFAAIDTLRRLPAPTPGPTGPHGDANNNNVPDSSTKPGVLLVRGEVPNILDWRIATLNATLTQASPNYALAWARLFSRRIPRDLNITGTLDLTASTGATPSDWTATANCTCLFPPFTKPADTKSETKPETKAPAKPAPNRWNIALHRDSTTPGAGMTLLAYPNPLPPDGKAEPTVPMVPAASLIVGKLNKSGYTLVYGSQKTAAEIATMLPPLGDNMPDDTTGPIQSERTFPDNQPGPQTWTAATAPTAQPNTPKHHKH